MIHEKRRALVRSGIAGGIAAATAASGLPDLRAQAGGPEGYAERDSPADLDVHIELTAVPDRVAIRPGKQTRVWRYRGKLLRGDASALEASAGTYLGPVIRVRRGQRVRIDLINGLPESTIIHWHGLHVPEAMDGHPRFSIAPGDRYVYEFTAVNRAAATGSTRISSAPASRSIWAWRACSWSRTTRRPPSTCPPVPTTLGGSSRTGRSTARTSSSTCRKARPGRPQRDSNDRGMMGGGGMMDGGTMGPGGMGGMMGGESRSGAGTGRMGQMMAAMMGVLGEKAQEQRAPFPVARIATVIFGAPKTRPLLVAIEPDAPKSKRVSIRDWANGHRNPEGCMAGVTSQLRPHRQRRESPCSTGLPKITNW